MRFATSSLLLLIPLLLKTSSALAVTSPELPLSTDALGQGELKLGFGGSYLNTTTSFDRSGAKQHSLANGSIRSIQGDLFGQYGASSDLTLLLNIPYVANTVSGTSSLASGGSVTNTAYGPGDLTAGVRLEPWKTPVRAGFDALVQFPLYSRLLTDDWAVLKPAGSVPLGTGVSEFTIMGRLAVPLAEDVSVQLGGGLTARTGGFSDLLPYEAYLKYEERRGLFLRVGLKGYFSISTDEFSASPQSSLPNERSTVAEAQSELYNAIDPSNLSAAGAFGAYFGRHVFLMAGAELPLIGRDAVAQPLFTVALGIDLGGKDAQPKYQHSNRGFQEYYLASKVVRVSNQLRQILIDKGAPEMIKKGELLDVFEPDEKDGTFGETVARGRVIEVGPTKSKVQLLEFFKEEPVQEGFVVRRPVR